MPQAGAPIVVVEGVSKAFHFPHEHVHTLKERAVHPFRRRDSERLDALRDVTFSVEQGEFFGIVGRNGSGKSTLLKCMAGIYSTDSGAIEIGGRLSAFIELGVGFNPDLAAYDNVVLNGIMLGLSPREARARFDSVIEFAELEDFVDLKLKNYSSGMQVRLAFSVMVHVDADVLLIDEVLAVGDAAFQQKCFDVFFRLKEEGKTILFVTHDMSSVQRFCHRAVLLEKGVVRLVGDPERVANHYVEVNFGRDRLAGGGSEAAEGEERFGSGGAAILETWFEDDRGERTTTLPQGCLVLGEHEDPLQRDGQGPRGRCAARERAAPTAVRDVQRGRRRLDRRQPDRDRGGLLDPIQEPLRRRQDLRLALGEGRSERPPRSPAAARICARHRAAALRRNRRATARDDLRSDAS